MINKKGPKFTRRQLGAVTKSGDQTRNYASWGGNGLYSSPTAILPPGPVARRKETIRLAKQGLGPGASKANIRREAREKRQYAKTKWKAQNTGYAYTKRNQLRIDPRRTNRTEGL
jgi:hypothetical protein